MIIYDSDILYINKNRQKLWRDIEKKGRKKLQLYSNTYFATEVYIYFAGIYTICIDNVASKSMFGSKLVYFYLGTYLMADWDKYLQEIEGVTSTVSNFTASIYDNFHLLAVPRLYLFVSSATYESFISNEFKIISPQWFTKFISILKKCGHRLVLFDRRTVIQTRAWVF